MFSGLIFTESKFYQHGPDPRWTAEPIVKDPRAARPYLIYDGQNIYNLVLIVCTVNIYIPASLGRRPILRKQVLQVPTKLY